MRRRKTMPDRKEPTLSQMMNVVGAEPAVAIATSVLSGEVKKSHPKLRMICREFLERLDCATAQRTAILSANPLLSQEELAARLDRDPRIFELEAEILNETSNWFLKQGGEWESSVN